MDSRLRGNDNLVSWCLGGEMWIPAPVQARGRLFAGMTRAGLDRQDARPTESIKLVTVN